jgi:hypothetical protein
VDVDEKPPMPARVSRLTGSNLLGFADFGNPLPAGQGARPFQVQEWDMETGSCKAPWFKAPFDWSSAGRGHAFEHRSTDLRRAGRPFILFLLVGLLLPGSWEARAEAAFPAPPEAVFPFLEQPDRWTLWMPLPPSGVQSFGPRQDRVPASAGMTPTTARGSSESWRVRGLPGFSTRWSWKEGSIHVRGVLTLSPEDGGTLLHGRSGVTSDGTRSWATPPGGWPGPRARP